MGKVALITGVTGQDGAYLADCCWTKAISSTASSAAPRRSTPGASTISIRIRTRPISGFVLHYGDMTDSTNLIRIVQQMQPDEIYNLAAQSHVQVSFETAGIHRQRRRAGHAAPAGSDPHSRPGKKTALLSGLDLGAVRQGAGDAAERDHAVLSAQPLCRGQALCLLDHGELPRGLWHARLQRHPVQSREPAARRDLRHPQDHPRRGRDQARACRTGSISAISTPSATGAMRATMSRACG